MLQPVLQLLQLQVVVLLVLSAMLSVPAGVLSC
jgi:hypothetical protein